MRSHNLLRPPHYATVYICTILLFICSFSKVQATISIVSFKGVQTQSTIDLEWITMAEENTGSFKVQFSTDGKNWKEISSVDAAGMSTEQIIYTFHHTEIPDAENIYYRLKIVGADENMFLYSDIISVVITTVVPVEETVQVYFDLSGKQFTTLDEAPSGIYIVAKGKERNKIYLNRD